LYGVFCYIVDLAVFAWFELQRLVLYFRDDIAFVGFDCHEICEVILRMLLRLLMALEWLGCFVSDRVLALIS
ncbi:transcriptional regulator, partial [Escherichia coli]|uniref:hypothetical protein n=1 Tax=Escherichia coli TaxID=562 RepID=UPI003F79322F|nr:transcriptional regulator [Escherichia coli]